MDCLGIGRMADPGAILGRFDFFRDDDFLLAEFKTPFYGTIEFCFTEDADADQGFFKKIGYHWKAKKGKPQKP